MCLPPNKGPWDPHLRFSKRNILGGVSYKGSRKNVKHMPLYCETCHLSGSSGNGAQQGFVPRGPHVALSRCWDIMDFSSRRLLTLAQALRTSCSLIRLREQRPGVVVVGPSPGPHHKRGGFCGHSFFRNGRGITNACRFSFERNEQDCRMPPSCPASDSLSNSQVDGGAWSLGAPVLTAVSI